VVKAQMAAPAGEPAGRALTGSFSFLPRLTTADLLPAEAIRETLAGGWAKDRALAA